MEEASYLLLLDAVWTCKSPGTIVEIAGEGLFGSFPLKFSAHDIALPDLLALLRLRRGPKLHTVALLGMVPDPLTPSTELSPRLQKSFSRLLTRAERILQNWIDGMRGFPEERSTPMKASRR
jgi:hydrogenase maturation protease